MLRVLWVETWFTALPSSSATLAEPELWGVSMPRDELFKPEDPKPAEPWLCSHRGTPFS
jgi:hypothetical protein